jgi:threonyl-tRNA synthetase
MHNEQDLQKLRHSVAHLIAHAVLELWPHTKLTIGPATLEGFFYDFLPERNFRDEDLPIIAARMGEIADLNLTITHQQVSKKEARILYKDNPFKLELIDGIEGDTVGIARQGDFHDLCKGGHVASTGMLKNFKLLHISGSYWRADKTKQPLQRITGTAFFTAQELADYEKQVEEAMLYDHRRLGKQLDLFSFHEEGIGFPFFHAKGKKILTILTNYLRTTLEADNYQEISTPIMLSDELWKTSGHYAHYKKNMYFCYIDETTYAIRPMNCPGSILVYKSRPRSYRELPLKLAEFGLVHRHELSGVLHGLFRARSFTIDDGHLYCAPEHLEQEVVKLITMITTVLKRFEFSQIHIGLSTRPDNAMGSDDLWEKATHALKQGLDATSSIYKIQEGEGAFYGPKIEFVIEDSMKRQWQCGTIQIDFFQPENFDLSYVASSGKKERPVMIHRAIYGSFERFFGILLEHYKGNLPFWLAPVSVRLLTITDAQKPYAQMILQKFSAAGIRAELDESGEQLAAQIKSAQLDKIPWMVVIGKKEVEANTVTLRHRGGTQEMGITVEELIEKARLLSN